MTQCPTAPSIFLKIYRNGQFIILISSLYPPISDHHNSGMISNHPQIIDYDEQSVQYLYDKKPIRSHSFKATVNEIRNVSTWGAVVCDQQQAGPPSAQNFRTGCIKHAKKCDQTMIFDHFRLATKANELAITGEWRQTIFGRKQKLPNSRLRGWWPSIFRRPRKLLARRKLHFYMLI